MNVPSAFTPRCWLNRLYKKTKLLKLSSILEAIKNQSSYFFIWFFYFNPKGGDQLNCCPEHVRFRKFIILGGAMQRFSWYEKSRAGSHVEENKRTENLSIRFGRRSWHQKPFLKLIVCVFWNDWNWKWNCCKNTKLRNFRIRNNKKFSVKKLTLLIIEVGKVRLYARKMPIFVMLIRGRVPDDCSEINPPLYNIFCCKSVYLILFCT